MASDTPDKNSFLAIIDAKLAALQALRESYVAALETGAFGQGEVDQAALAVTTKSPTTGSTGRTGGQPMDLPTGAFRNKSMSDAIRLCLDAGQRKQTLEEIVAGLQEGGLVTTAKDFKQTVNATLHRLKEAGELLQFKDGWDLAASYPDSLRQRLAQTKESGAPKRQRKAKRKGASASKAKATKPEKAEPAPVLRAV